MTTDLKIVDGTPVVYQDLGLYEGHIPVFMEKLDKPVLHWKGEPISAELWEQIVSFMRWTFRTYKSEAQLRLYYNDIEHKWGVGVFPQEVCTGMSSKELPDHPCRDIVFGEHTAESGWREAGTVHHHCSTSAFQSSTDFNDEKDKNGLHITLGDMESDKAHGFHARASFRKVMYSVLPHQWLASPMTTKEEAEVSFGGIGLLVPDSRRHFPNTWKRFLVEKKSSCHVYSGNQQNRGTFQNRNQQNNRRQVGFSGTRGRDFNDDYDEDWYLNQFKGNHVQGNKVKEPIDLERFDWDEVKDSADTFDIIGPCITPKLATSDPDDLRLYLGAVGEIVDKLDDMMKLVMDEPNLTATVVMLDAVRVHRAGVDLDWNLLRNLEADLPVLQELGYFNTKEEEKDDSKTAPVSGERLPPVGGIVVPHHISA